MSGMLGGGTPGDGTITLAKMADLAQDKFIVRTTASTGVPETATVTAAARTVLDDTTVGAMLATMSGVSGVGTDYKVARGETALDGSNPTTVATGLTSVIAFTATLKGTASTGLGTSVLFANISGANVDVYAWKPTSAGNCTLIASTGTETFYWIAVGT